MNTSSRYHLSPGRGRLRRRQLAKLWPNFLHQRRHGLIGDDNASLSQKQLNITQAKVEHMIQPDSMADDLGGEPMTVMRV